MIFNLIDGHSIPIPCPNCEYVTDVSVREARMETAILCAGCRSTIQFVEDGSTRSGMRAIEEQERALRRTIDRINRSGFLKITLGSG